MLHCICILFLNADKMKLRATKTYSEEELIEQCRRGKSKAQKTLYDKFSPAMLGLCARYVKDIAEAEDIMIKGFLKIFEKIGQYEGKGSFEGWMKRIMVNQALMFIRQNKALYLEVDIDYAAKQPDYNWANDTFDAEELQQLVDSLPSGYKTIFNLYAIEGYSHREIAEMLGINENTSKSQLSRARALLQKQLVKLEELNKKERHERV